jgi:hypothetical protein
VTRAKSGGKIEPAAVAAVEFIMKMVNKPQSQNFVQLAVNFLIRLLIYR